MLTEVATGLVVIVVGAGTGGLLPGLSRRGGPAVPVGRHLPAPGSRGVRRGVHLHRDPPRRPGLPLEGGRPGLGANDAGAPRAEGRPMSNDPAHGAARPIHAPASFGPEAHVLVGNADQFVNWARKSSLWYLLFATACCGIELMQTGASRGGPDPVGGGFCGAAGPACALCC